MHTINLFKQENVKFNEFKVFASKLSLIVFSFMDVTYENIS